MILTVLENFQLAKIRFNLKAQENELLPKYKGSVMREGFIGNITYTGNFYNLIPFIALGEQIHLGKNITFGLGKYKICNGK